ncbi:MAG: autotransporter outer membrane beta-barrel domain-containing protein [Planctomycetota bacterium]|jgi:hypothetical protein
MAAGDRVFLGEPGSDVVLEIDAPSLPEPVDPVDIGPGVLNEGTVDAAGGTIVLAAAGDIYSQAISNVGSLSVSVETDDAGQIKLIAPHGQVANAGTIEASGNAGGVVKIDGAKVTLSGDSAIHADAAGDGDGGTIQILADILNLDGIITAGSIDGTPGHILLDPLEITIDAPAAATIVTALDTADVDVEAEQTINVNADIDSSTQTSATILSLNDENSDNDLTVNLNKSITLGVNQNLTGEGTTVNVLSEDASIQNGVDVAADGASITVADGTYTEDLTIDKSVTLEGAQVGNAVSGRTAGDVDESTVAGLHTVTASTVTIDGFSFADPAGGSGDVLLRLDSSGGVIDDVTLRNNFVGLGSGDIGVDLGGYSTTNGPITLPLRIRSLRGLGIRSPTRCGLVAGLAQILTWR